MHTDGWEKVGVIGQGIIGSRVAEVLRNTSRHVYVWSRTPRPISNFVGSPGEVAQLADIIQIFVSDGVALKEVINAMKDRLEKRHIVISNGTSDPESVVDAYQTVKGCGAAFLDAPFTGSRHAAEKGALVYYVGGDPKVLERARPVLEATSREILYLGRVGEATLIKIATNMISAVTTGVLAEAYGLVSKAGVDPQRLADALELNACYSGLIAMKLPQIMARDYEPHFSLKHMFKDAQYALNLAKQLGVEAPVLSTTASVMFRGIQKGQGDRDYSVLAARYQDAAEGKENLPPS
ncbi:MAG: NAD(P)-dependent oxidoreductase [Verrucomicrobiales bacterium]|nr:NAD(P)-dependent oxidoreductase [Verrucomicrobiales bacterium]